MISCYQNTTCQNHVSFIVLLIISDFFNIDRFLTNLCARNREKLAHEYSLGLFAVNSLRDTFAWGSLSSLRRVGYRKNYKDLDWTVNLPQHRISLISSSILWMRNLCCLFLCQTAETVLRFTKKLKRKFSYSLLFLSSVICTLVCFQTLRGYRSLAIISSFFVFFNRVNNLQAFIYLSLKATKILNTN